MSRPLARWLRTAFAPRPVTPTRSAARRLAVESLEDRTVPATFTVTATADAGVGSLRQAILDANAHPNDPGSPDLIAFGISGGGTQTIRPLTSLPPITDPVIVDGYTQSGASANSLAVGDNAVLRIVLDGSSTAAVALANVYTTPYGTVGLSVTGSGSTIQGFRVQNFGVGIEVSSAGATGNTIQGNFVNTDGTTALSGGNDGGGIWVINASGNTVGGTSPPARNLVWSTDRGIFLGADGGLASNNVVAGNYIGVNAAGTDVIALNPTGIGIWTENADHTTIGGDTAGAGNVVAGEWIQIQIEANVTVVDGNVVTGNYVGTNATGTAALAEPQYSTGIGTAGGAGGTVVSNNLVAGMNGTAIAVSGDHDRVLNNAIGIDVTGLVPLPNSGTGIDAGGQQVVVSGNTVANCGGNGVTAGVSGSLVENNSIRDNAGAGVSVSGTGITIRGNSIHDNRGLGIDLSGAGVVANVPGGPFTGTDTSHVSNLTGVQSGSTVTVTGTLTGTLPNSTYYVLFGAYGTGKYPQGAYDTIGRAAIATDASGHSDFTINLPDQTNLDSDLGPGWTVNSFKVTPPHGGANYFQNYPVLTAAQAGSSVLVSGTLNGAANTTFTVDLYANPTADASDLSQGLYYGEGQYYLGSTTVTTDGSGNAAFAAAVSAAGLPGGTLPAGWYLSSTATDPGGNTSEFSADVQATGGNALQPALTAGGTVTIQTTTPQQAHDAIAAANGLNPATTPAATVVVDLGGQTIQDTTVNVPPQVTVQFVNGTFIGGSPALIVTSGVVIIRNSTFTNATNAPTILVTGGRLVLRGNTIQESTGFNQVAILVQGGTVDLGTATDPGGNTLTVNGAGLLIRNTGAAPVSAVGNTFAVGGTAVSNPYAIEDLIADALDAAGRGLVTFDPGNVYVTPSSGSIQRGVDAVAAGGTVYVKPGQYPLFTFGVKPVTVSYQGGPTVALQADPLAPGQVMLVVVGTAGDDTIRVRQADTDPNSIRVRIKDTDVGDLRVRGSVPLPISRVVVSGLGGDDTVTVDPDVTVPAWLYGGDGDDRLKGGSGNNVLLGGNGDNLLVGGDGRDILIGGNGADKLVGNASDDIVIAGWTLFDTNEAALAAVLGAWTDPTQTYQQRVNRITNVGVGAGLGVKLSSATVSDDGAKDTLTGSAGQDWFFANVSGSGIFDKITDLSAAEFANDLAFITGP